MLLQVEKEKEALRMELNKAKTQVSEAEAAISSQKSQIEKLNHVVQEADAGEHANNHGARMACVSS